VTLGDLALRVFRYRADFQTGATATPPIP